MIVKLNVIIILVYQNFSFNSNKFKYNIINNENNNNNMVLYNVYEQINRVFRICIGNYT